MNSRSEYILLLSIVVGVIVISMMKHISSNYIPHSYNPMNSRYESFVMKHSKKLMPSSLTDMDVNSEYINQTQNNTLRHLWSSKSPYGNEISLDQFANTPGSLSCVGSGYSNSQGSLCLTDANIQSLKTRGGNSTGRDSQIGTV